MTAKVKIASIERWCHGALKKLEEKPAYELLPEQECEIFTDTVTCWPYCDGRVWQLTPESINKLSQVTGMPPVGPVGRPVGGFCEHVLEMD